MNPKNYLKILLEKKLLIIAFALVIGLVSLIVSFFLPSKYQADISLTVHRINRENTSDFQYDNYYAVQASEYVSNTLVSMFAMPSIVSEIYKEAGLEEISVNQAIKSIKARQLSAHLVSVTVKLKNEEESRKVADSISKIISEKISKVEVTNMGKNSFAVEFSEPIVTRKKIDPVVILISGFVAGFLAACGFVFLKHYFSSKEEE